MAQKRLVAYYRVSTRRQGRSGLGLDAQRQAIAAYLKGGSWTLAAEYVEVESGRKTTRTQLRHALAACRLRSATLVVAKLDRLSRNAAFLLTLRDCQATPGADPLATRVSDPRSVATVHRRGVHPASAQRELWMIRRRAERWSCRGAPRVASHAAGSSRRGW